MRACYLIQSTRGISRDAAYNPSHINGETFCFTILATVVIFTIVTTPKLLFQHKMDKGKPTTGILCKVPKELTKQLVALAMVPLEDGRVSPPLVSLTAARFRSSALTVSRDLNLFPHTTPHVSVSIRNHKQHEAQVIINTNQPPRVFVVFVYLWIVHHDGRN